jgi:serine/threonine-protein kinase
MTSDLVFLPKGTKLDGYEIVRPLAHGASGSVYAAVRGTGDERGRDVALKVLHPHLVRDRQLTHRFEREAAILRRLRSNHIVPLLDFGQTEDGQLYMALELVQGRGLDGVIADEAPIAPERAIAIARQICEALSAAHAIGVVHRDLKPSNVVLERRDGEEVVRVLDFGLAKVLRGTSSSLASLTEQNMVFGTPDYMAPEQVRGDDVDGRCDIYSVGIVLYQMLTKTLPFSASTPIGIMTAHLVEMPPVPSSRDPCALISPALEAIVMHALAKDRELRYGSAAELAAALASALASPADVTSIAPPRSDTELPYRDTLHALPAAPSAPPPTLPAGPAAAAPANTADRAFYLVGLAAAALGIAAGLLASWLLSD